jgi:hypothetical protein
MKRHQLDFLFKFRRYALVASLWLLLLSVAIAGKSQAANLPTFFQNFDGGGFVTAPTTGGMTGYVNTQSVEGFAGLGTGTNVVSGALSAQRHRRQFYEFAELEIDDSAFESACSFGDSIEVSIGHY